MGAWIEISFVISIKLEIVVAPLVGAWIEIAQFINNVKQCSVAPLVGAWIEILDVGYIFAQNGSLPLWERGLK